MERGLEFVHQTHPRTQRRDLRLHRFQRVAQRFWLNMGFPVFGDPIPRISDTEYSSARYSRNGTLLIEPCILVFGVLDPSETYQLEVYLCG